MNERIEKERRRRKCKNKIRRKNEKRIEFPTPNFVHSHNVV